MFWSQMDHHSLKRNIMFLTALSFRKQTKSPSYPPNQGGKQKQTSLIINIVFWLTAFNAQFKNK